MLRKKLNAIQEDMGGVHSTHGILEDSIEALQKNRQKRKEEKMSSVVKNVVERVHKAETTATRKMAEERVKGIQSGHHAPVSLVPINAKSIVETATDEVNKAMPEDEEDVPQPEAEQQKAIDKMEGEVTEVTTRIAAAEQKLKENEGDPVRTEAVKKKSPS